LRSLVASGKSVIFITHKLKEVMAVADHITVLRGGRVVGTATPLRPRRRNCGHDGGAGS